MGAAVTFNPNRESQGFPEPLQGNILHLMLALANRIRLHTGQKAENNSRQTEELKLKYRTFSQEGANLTRTMGRVGLIPAVASLITMGTAQIFFGEQGQAIGKCIAEQLPHLSGVVTSEYGARQRVADSTAQLTHSEVSSKLQPQSDPLKDSTQQLLSGALGLYRAASGG